MCIYIYKNMYMDMDICENKPEVNALYYLVRAVPLFLLPNLDFDSAVTPSIRIDR